MACFKLPVVGLYYEVSVYPLSCLLFFYLLMIIMKYYIIYAIHFVFTNEIYEVSVLHVCHSFQIYK